MSNPYPKALQLARGERRYRRKVASAKQWQALWQEKVAGQTCRLCFTSLPPLEAHHLVSRAALGDDVAENLVPLCPGCHAAVTTRAPGALRLLSSRLLVSERVYIVGKLGEGGMERLFGVGR